MAMYYALPIQFWQSLRHKVLNEVFLRRRFCWQVSLGLCIIRFFVNGTYPHVGQCIAILRRNPRPV